MKISKRLNYWNRIISAYVFKNVSQLTFWHGEPEINPHFVVGSLGPYYMSFKEKANYDSKHDKNGIPMLDYKGKIGLQYNPIAIAQWGLGNYNLWIESQDSLHYLKFIKSANWLTDNLEINKNGYKVWMHYFDFEYRETLKSPW